MSGIAEISLHFPELAIPAPRPHIVRKIGPSAHEHSDAANPTIQAIRPSAVILPNPIRSCLCALGLSAIPVPHGIAAELRAVDFGVVADGKTDDAPAIARMIAAAKEFGGGAVNLVFPEGKVIHAATAADRYLFSLRGMRNLSVDGNGSTFLLDPHIRMADLHFAENVVLKDFTVDFTASMFVETTVHSFSQPLGFVDVKPRDAAEAKQLAGPTEEDGEQWFGGFIWCENGPHPKAARHYGIGRVEKLENGIVRLFHGEGAFTPAMARTIVPGATAFSVPRAGVAHRHGPGALFEIHDSKDVTLERIRVWGAPWFVFSVYRCEGFCRFLDVDVVPKPDSGRLMSACRDAFHVTANRAKLLFEHCDTQGLGDDDYNFCILSSAIREVVSPTQIVIRQKFPIQYNPMRAGETLMVMDAENSVVGSAKITRYVETPLKNGSDIVPGGSSPEVTIHLDEPIANLAAGLTVWSKEAANPDTTLSHCTATFSIRMQTSLKIDHCRFACYNVSYGMSPRDQNVEGPGSESMHITNSVFLTGRGAGYVAQSGGKGPFDRTRIQNIHIEGCTFHAPLRIAKARAITLRDNAFHGEVVIGGSESLDARGNSREGKPFSKEAMRNR